MPLAVVRRTRAALLFAAVVAAGTFTASACARAPRRAGRGAPEPQAVTTVRVQNQNFLDMNVYVIQGGARSRLGTATGNSTTRFTIPATLVHTLSQLRFLADPIGGRGSPVSEEITVSPGDEVTLTIPPS